MIDRFRYIVAVITIVILSAIPVFWLLVHVLTPLWRRIGPRATYVITLGIAVVVGVIVYRNRTALLGVDLGTHWMLMTIAIGVFGFMAWFERKYWQHSNLKVLLGLPELSSAGQEKPRVMRNGFYAVMRHPRYFSGTIGLVGSMLLSNFVGLYVLVLLMVPLGYLLIVLEERELVARFGDDYRMYQREVPRFFPRTWKTG